MATVCPVCGKDDMIQKISAIRKEGTSTGSFAGPSGGVAYVGGKFSPVGGYSSLSGRSSTMLAQLLPPPDEPKMETGSSCGWIVFTLVFGMVGLATVFACSVTYYGLRYGGNIEGNNGFIIPVGLILFGYCLLWSMVILALIFRNQELQPDIDERNAKAMLEWSIKMEIYNSLYYCHRDDVSFDPNRPDKPVPILETWKLLTDNEQTA